MANKAQFYMKELDKEVSYGHACTLACQDSGGMVCTREYNALRKAESEGKQ